jgi:hypothetical protein
MFFTVPGAVERLLTADVAAEIARTYGDQPVYPDRVLVDSAAEPSLRWPVPARRFPGWRGPVLVLSDENQGVCSWGVPLNGDSRVVVGGDMLEGGRITVPYAASVQDFIAARRWDRQCLAREPVLMAQAAELDQASLSCLQTRLLQVPGTGGWPGQRQYRFEDEGNDVRVMLWAGAGQCDWHVSAASRDSLMAVAAGLIELPSLRQALWSNDEASTRMLSELRGQRH